MLDKMSKALSGVQAEFVDLRRELDDNLTVLLVNGSVESVSDNSSGAYFARAISDGGFATNCFALDAPLGDELKKAAELARESAKHRKDKTLFADVDAVQDEVLLSPERHPASVSLDEKIKLLKHYDGIVRKSKKIQRCQLQYVELSKKKWLVNSEGTRIHQEQLICFISGQIIAKDGDVMEDVRVAVGGTEDFVNLIGREAEFKRKAKVAIELLSAEKVSPGVFKVLLNPQMAGLFIHESFGHFSEADLVADNPELLAKMQLGTPIASEVLNVIDDGTIHGVPGWWIYDDEGVKSRATVLIENGVLKGRMHSRETAAKLGEPLSGNTVSESSRHLPIVRMSNIYIKPGSSSFEDMLAKMQDGVYVCDAKGGQTMGDLYSFGAQYGYEVKGGKLGKMVKSINLSGNLFKTLKNIQAVGDDLSFREVGGCGKGGQLNLKSGLGGPHVLIDQVTIG